MDIIELREKIDAVDAQLIALFAERMQVAADIAAYKRENDIPVLDEARERQKLSAVADAAPEGLGDYTRLLFSHLMDLSRAYQGRLLQKELHGDGLSAQIKTAMAQTSDLFGKNKSNGKAPKIACQGVWGAYSQHAADQLFKEPELLFFDTFEAVFSAVEKGLCDYGVVPAENNRAGSVHAVYDLMMERKFSIVRSTRVKIDHSLLVKPGTGKEDIKTIYSHEQALSQCASYLHREFPSAALVSCKNTAEAAMRVGTSAGADAAAIASPDCASLYGLHRLDDNIQGSDNNRTRFFCISKKPEIYPGADKTSMILELPHKPGALYRILARFYAHGVNLIKLESRPILGTDFSFRFCFEIEAQVTDPAFLSLMDELSEMGDDIKYLGSYAEVM